MAAVGDGFVYLAIPKCGGTWCKAALNAAGVDWWEDQGEHGIPRKKEADPRLWFTVIRDPASWLRSYYHFRCVHKIDIYWHLDVSADRSQTFSRFVEDVYTRNGGGVVGRIFAEYTDHADVVYDLTQQPEMLARILARCNESFDYSGLHNCEPINRGKGLASIKVSDMATIRENEPGVYRRWEDRMGW